MGKTVDATIARRQLGRLLDEVYYRGESFIIERKGKPLAKIVPAESIDRMKGRLTPTQRELLAELNSLPVFQIEEEPTELLRKIRKKRAVKARK